MDPFFGHIRFMKRKIVKKIMATVMHCAYIHFVGAYNGESEKMSVNSNIKLEWALME